MQSHDSIVDGAVGCTTARLRAGLKVLANHVARVAPRPPMMHVAVRYPLAGLGPRAPLLLLLVLVEISYEQALPRSSIFVTALFGRQFWQCYSAQSALIP